MWQLKPAIWRDILNLNMKEWVIPEISGHTLLLMSRIWSYTLNLNIKEWDILVLIVNCSQASNLKMHVEIKNDGMRYPCLHCVYAATTARYLKRHIESEHEGVRYPCSHCKYVATQAVIWRYILKINMKEWDIHATNVYTLPLRQVV